MRTEYINVGKSKWGIVVCFDYDVYDFDDMWAIMRSFGMSNRKAREALHVLSKPNTGMCVSNIDIRMSVIFISDATSTSEWWSTCLHEIRHAAQAIIEYYGADLGEDDAYLTGFLTKQVVEKIAEPCI